MSINTNQIQISINKSQLTSIVSDILASEDNGALLRAINPALSSKFTQFPEFTNVSITGINEDGSANVTLRQPRVSTPGTEVEPTEVEVEPELTDEPVEAEPAPFED